MGNVVMKGVIAIGHVMVKGHSITVFPYPSWYLVCSKSIHTFMTGICFKIFMKQTAPTYLYVLKPKVFMLKA